MKEQYFIFTDIDGTLYDHGHGGIPQSAIDTLHQLKANGHKVFLCSGRNYNDIDPFLYELPIDGLVVGGGAHVVLKNGIEKQKPMPKKELDFLTQYLTSNDIGFALEGVKKMFLFGEAKKMYCYFMESLGIHPNVTEDNVMDILRERNTFPYEEITEKDYFQTCKLSFYSTKKQELEDLINMLPDTIIGYFDNMSDVMSTGEFYMKDTSKFSGIEMVCEALNHPLNKTIAIGDNLNDLEMIKYAKIGIAMGNACDELKQNADYVTKNIHEDGFEYAFKHLNLI